MDNGCHDCVDVDGKGCPKLLSEKRVAKWLKPIEAAESAAAATTAASTNHPIVPLLCLQQTATASQAEAEAEAAAAS